MLLLDVKETKARHPKSDVMYDAKTHGYVDETLMCMIDMQIPKGWGEGYGIEQAMHMLARRYKQLYGKKWKHIE